MKQVPVRSTFHDCNFRTEEQNWRLLRTAHAQWYIHIINTYGG